MKATTARRDKGAQELPRGGVKAFHRIIRAIADIEGIGEGDS
jgi:hypothetical protein